MRRTPFAMVVTAGVAPETTVSAHAQSGSFGRILIAAIACSVVLLADRPAAAQVSPAASTIQLQKDLAETLVQTLPLVRELRADLQTGARPAADKIARLVTFFDQIRASDLLLSNEHDGLAEMLRAQGTGTVAQRHDQMRAQYRQHIDEILLGMNRIAASTSQRDTSADLGPALDVLIRELEKAVAPADRIPLGISLPLRPLSLPQKEPQLGDAIVPAYADRTVPSPVAADSAASSDAPLDSAILAQANARHQDPIEILEFVRNQVASEFYHGAMKGADETLSEKSGNDIDQASLLVALMRASGIPARYVRGVVSLSGPQAMMWTGVSSTRRVSELLTRAGIPFRSIRQGGTIGAFEVEHTWTEVYVPYANYRGVPLDASGRTWIPLDPSFKAVVFTPGVDVPDGANFKADALVSSYLSKPQTLSPVDFFKKTLTDFLASSGSTVTLDQLTSSVTVQQTSPGLLPSTLPYATASVNAEFAAIPDTLRHRVRFVAAGDGDNSFDVTVPTSDLLGRRLTLSYGPAEVEDQIIADSFLGLDDTPVSLVKVRPVLKVGGVVRAAGQVPIQMGALHDFTIEIQTPRATIPITNRLVAGGYFAIGLAAGGTVAPPSSDVFGEDDTEGAGGANELYRLAIDYLNQWNEADRFLAGILRVATVRPTVSEVMVGGFYTRTLLFGEPQAIEWRGVLVDADLRISEPVPTGTDDRPRQEFMRLSGLAGSMLEGDVLQQHIGVEAISAARLLQLARAGGIPVRDIDASNASAILPLLQTADEVTRDIADAVNQGFRVTIPQTDFARNIWDGIGYIVLDPESGAGGYFISGGLAGGTTIDDPQNWNCPSPTSTAISECVKQQLADWFKQPHYSSRDHTNTNPNAAASIQKIPLTDGNGTVGKRFPKPLFVWVRDAEGKAVQGAEVTFKVLAGGADFDGSETITRRTDMLGLARAILTLGKHTTDSPLYVTARPGDQKVTQVGQNLITATVKVPGGTIALLVPFQLFGLPGPPHHIVKVLGDGNRTGVGTAAGTIRASVVDQYENPISNLPVIFKVEPAANVLLRTDPSAAPLPDTAKNLVIYPSSPPCANPLPILDNATDCGAVGELTSTTSIVGAQVETILGNTMGTEFHVSAASKDLPSQIFRLFSEEFRGFTGEYIGPKLSLGLLELVNDRGAVINATKIGTVFRRPLGVVLYVAEDDDYDVVPIEGPCPPGADCFKVKSKGTTRTRPIDIHMSELLIPFKGTTSVPKADETATVKFRSIQGGGSLVPPDISADQARTQNPGQGHYFSQLTVGGQPAVNRIEVSADAMVYMPAFDLHEGKIVKPKFDHLSGQSAVHFEVFGVRARFPEKKTVLVGSSGGTTKDYTLDYVIEPPTYQAQDTHVDLFKVNPLAQVGQQDEPSVYFLGDKLGGAGLAKVFHGTGFDPSVKYRMQVVLNRGTEVEIKSDKEDLGAYLVAPLGVDFRSKRNTEVASRRKEDIDLAAKLIAEKDQMIGIIRDGLAQAAACGLPDRMAMIEQGSGACFWSDKFRRDPVGACPGFQAGISDHDYEVFIPRAVPPDPQVKCIIEKLTKAAENAQAGDYTFFYLPLEELLNTELNIDLPLAQVGADPLGDLALGRQTLLLSKILLEGQYVKIPGSMLSAPDRLDLLLEKLKNSSKIDARDGEGDLLEPTGILRLEGYEQATLQEYAFYKSHANLRLTGKAVDPKSSLFELLQKELHNAAKAAIRAALGRLVASSKGNKLLFITRAQYGSDGLSNSGCLTGAQDPSNPPPPLQLFPKSCDTFEEHVASTAVKSLTAGPNKTNLGIFSEEQVRQIYQFFRVKADPACAAEDCHSRIMDEVEINKFLGSAIRFIEQMRDETFDVWNATLTNPMYSDLVQAVTRKKNVDRAHAETGTAKKGVSRKLAVRVFNDADIQFNTVPLNMASDAAGDDTQKPYTVKRIPPRSETRETVIDIEREPDEQGKPKLDPVTGQEKPIFKLTLPSDAPHKVTFVLDPGTTIQECNKKDNYTGFFTYPFDKNNPALPSFPDLPDPPIPIPDSPKECVDNPWPSLKVLTLVNGQPDIQVAPYTPLKITHEVTNTSPVPITGIVLHDARLERDYGPITLAPNAHQVFEDRFVPTTFGKKLISPTEAIGFVGGTLAASAWDSVVIDVVKAPCDVNVVPLDPDPNPYKHYRVDAQGQLLLDQRGRPIEDAAAPAVPVSEIMQGGTVFRHYRLFSATGGPVSAAVTIAVSPQGASGGPTTTGASGPDGVIEHWHDDKWEGGLELDSQLFDHVGPYLARFVPAGHQSVCGQPFWVLVKEREFTRSLKGGTSIALEGELVEVEGSLKAGFGLDVSLAETSSLNPGTTAPTTRTQSISLSRLMNGELGIFLHPTSFVDETDVGVEVNANLGEAEAGMSVLEGASDTHEFPYPLTPDSYLKIAYLFANTLVTGTAAAAGNVVTGGIGGPVIAVVLNEILEHFTGLGASRTSIGAYVGIQREAEAEAGLGMSVPNTNIPGLDAFGLNLEGNASADWALVAAFDYSPPKKEVAASAELRAAFDAKVAFEGAAADIFHGVLPEPVHESVEDLEGLFTAEADLAGAIKLTAFVDTQTLTLKQVTVSLTHKLKYGITFNHGSLVDGGDGNQYSRSYVIADPELIVKAVDKFSLINALARGLHNARSQINPLRIAHEFEKEIAAEIVGMMTMFDSYEKTVAKTKEVTPKFGKKTFVLGEGYKAEVEFPLDSSTIYRLEQGTFREGKMYVLERYPVDDDAHIPTLHDELVNVLNDAVAAAKAKVQAAFGFISRSVAATLTEALTELTLHFSPSGVRLRIQNRAESAPFDAELLAFKYKPLAGPVAAQPQNPSDITGPADKPHYGIGGFFQFLPEERPLAAPAELQVTYLDSEVASLDERTLAIYAWNAAILDWDYVGGTVDSVNKTVTANVNKLRLYTVAPAMPAGRFTFTSRSTSTGSGSDAATMATFASTPIHMNNGTVVPDGTLFTVQTLVPQANKAIPFGTVDSADEDSLTDGIQVASHGGVIQFTARVPGSAGVVRVVAFPTAGTALGDQAIPFSSR